MQFGAFRDFSASQDEMARFENLYESNRMRNLEERYRFFMSQDATLAARRFGFVGDLLRDGFMIYSIDGERDAEIGKLYYTIGFHYSYGYPELMLVTPATVPGRRMTRVFWGIRDHILAGRTRKADGNWAAPTGDLRACARHLLKIATEIIVAHGFERPSIDVPSDDFLDDHAYGYGGYFYHHFVGAFELPLLAARLTPAATVQVPVPSQPLRAPVDCPPSPPAPPADGATPSAPVAPRQSVMSTEMAELTKQGIDYYRKNEYDAARKCLERVIESYPDSYDANLYLGRVHLYDKRPAAAEPYLEVAIALRPDASDGYSDMGQVMARQQRFPDAIKYCRKAVARNNGQWPRMRLGEYLRENGQVDEAISELSRLVADEPTFAWGYYELRRAHLWKGDLDSALTTSEQALVKSKPDLEWALLTVARLKSALESRFKAEHSCRNAIEKLGDRAGLSRLLTFVRKYREIPREMEGKPQETPMLDDVRGLLTAAKNVQSPVARRRLVATAVVIDPSSYEACLSAGLCECENFRYESAERLLLRAHAYRPTDHMPLERLGLTYQAMGRLDEALKRSQESLSRAPADVGGLLLLATVLRDLGRFDESLVVLQTLKNQQPEKAGLQAIIDTVHARKKRGLPTTLEECLFRRFGAAVQQWGDDDAPISAAVSTVRAYDDAHGNWLYVTFGLSNHDGRQTQRPDSGGEITMRVSMGSTTPPQWPAEVVDWLGRASAKGQIELRHHFGFGLNGTTLTGKSDTVLDAVAFITDPQVYPFSTGHRTIRFFEAVGMTESEYDACRNWSFDAVLNRIGVDNPLWATDITRKCFIDTDADFALDWYERVT